jgi:toxin YoeB
VRVHFSANGWDDYQQWLEDDPAVLSRINALIKDARRTPFKGLGKPEALRGDLSGFWSRRVTGEHRLVYRVQGNAGLDQRIEILMCRHHYQ